LDLVCGKNAHIIAVTTGGKLLEIAEKNNFDIVNVAPGLQPRAALGLSMALNLLLLEKIGLVLDNVMTQFFENSLDKLKSVSNQYSTFSNDNPAIQFAELIHNKFPIIYAGEGWQANCALRMRGQLAENAKILGSHLNFPEQNHNEIEGWTCNKDIIKNTIICWILDKDDHIQVQKRMKITKELLSEYPSNQIELKTEGNSEIERALCLIHLIDWISYYSALLNKVDPTPVERITELKNKLK
jgi:glucose/mannose-6-phosphate isomerase